MNETTPLTVEQRTERRRFMLHAGLGTYLIGVCIGVVVAPIVSFFVFLVIGWAFVYGDGQPPLWFIVYVILFGAGIAFVLPFFPARTAARRKYANYVAAQRSAAMPHDPIDSL